MNDTDTVTDILCDMCGESTRTLEGYEKGTLCAGFNEGFHAGDQFVVDLCQMCFDELLHHVIVECMGTCVHHNKLSGTNMDMEDLREFYAHMGSGTLIVSEEDFEDLTADEEDEQCEP